MHDSVAAMWRAFLAANPDAAETDRHLSSFHFCDNEHDANECARLVVAGLKRATSPSVWSFEIRGEPLPKPGDLHVVTNWAGEAQCIIRTTAVAVVPFQHVTEEHAAEEGEGDRTLAWWRPVHWDYYARELAGTEFQPSSDMPIVCERFERVW